MLAGVKSLIKLPLSSWYSTSSTSTNSSSSPYLSPLQPAAVAFEDLQQLPKPEALIMTKQLRDDDRVLEGLVPAPAGSLLVAPDNLGRVLLLEGASMAAVRIWKVCNRLTSVRASLHVAAVFVQSCRTFPHKQPQQCQA
jgi:hypothetical protein